MVLIFKEKFSLRLSVTISVISYALVATLFNLEIYPLAPYTMYSYPYYNVPYTQLEVFIINNSGEYSKTKSYQLFPWDEARLKSYIKKQLDVKNTETIKSTLLEILNHKTGPMVGLKVERHKWNKFTLDSLKNPEVEMIAEVRK